MLDFLVEFQVIRHLDDLAIDPSADVAALHHVGEEIFELAFLATDHRREQHEPRAVGQGKNPRQNLFAGLGGNGALAFRAMALAHPCVQHAQKVGDFRNRPDRGAGVAPGGFLLDADRRRQPANKFNIRFGKLAQELTGVIRQTFDVPALAFGVQRVERER